MKKKMWTIWEQWDHLMMMEVKVGMGLNDILFACDRCHLAEKPDGRNK